MGHEERPIDVTDAAITELQLSRHCPPEHLRTLVDALEAAQRWQESGQQDDRSLRRAHECLSVIADAIPAERFLQLCMHIGVSPAVHRTGEVVPIAALREAIVERTARHTGNLDHPHLRPLTDPLSSWTRDEEGKIAHAVDFLSDCYHACLSAQQASRSPEGSATMVHHCAVAAGLLEKARRICDTQGNGEEVATQMSTVLGVEPWISFGQHAVAPLQEAIATLRRLTGITPAERTPSPWKITHIRETVRNALTRAWRFLRVSRSPK